MPGRGPAPRPPRTSGKTPSAPVDAARCCPRNLHPPWCCRSWRSRATSNSTSTMPDGVGDPDRDPLGPGRDHPEHDPAAPQSCPTRSTEVTEATRAVQRAKYGVLLHRRYENAAGAVEHRERPVPQGVGVSSEDKEGRDPQHPPPPPPPPCQTAGLGHSMDEDASWLPYFTAEERSSRGS